MISRSYSRGLIPVFKFETCEGRMTFLRKTFPGAIHIGVMRDLDKTLSSVLNQSKLGNFGFLAYANRLIQPDPLDFSKLRTSFQTLSISKSISAFETFEKRRVQHLSDADFLLDLTNPETITATLANVSISHKTRLIELQPNDITKYLLANSFSSLDQNIDSVPSIGHLLFRRIRSAIGVNFT